MKTFAIVFVLVVAGITGFAASKPDTFYVERVLRMKAPPAIVFAVISDFNTWSDWSPWVAKDPGIEITLGDQTTGMGARYEWAGNKSVGRGRLEIVTVTPPNSLRLKLAIFEPVLADHLVEFSLTTFGDFTKVTWSMQGTMDFKAKLMSIFTPMDTLVGPDFLLGLNRLKAVAEHEARAAIASPPPAG